MAQALYSRPGNGRRSLTPKLRLLVDCSCNGTIPRRRRRRGSFRFEMLCAKMALDAAAPASHKGKIQRPADRRAGERNQAPCPFFCRFGANLGSEAFGNARSKFLEKLFFGQILAVIDARGSRGRLPHFDPLLTAVSFKSVEQRKALDEPQRDNREQAGIRQERDHATQAESRAFRQR